MLGILNKILKHGLFKDTMLYGIGDAIQKGMAFLTLPLFSRYILPAELGIVANYDVLQQIVMLIAGQAIVNALPYFYYKRDKRQVALLVSNLIFIILIINIICSIIIFLTNNIIEKYLLIGIGLQIFSVFNVLFTLLISLDNVLFRLEENPRFFLTLSIISTVVNFSLLIYLIVGCKLGGLGKIYGQFIGAAILCAIHTILLYRRGYFILKFSKEDIVTLLRFGIPLLPHSLSFWIKSGMDKIFLTSICGLAINGLYSMAMSFGAIYTIFRNSFGNAYVPYLQKRISQMTEDNIETEKYKIVRLSYILMASYILLGIAAVAISWFAIKYLLSTKYSGSLFFIPWIMASLTIYSIYGLVIEFAYTSGKTAGIGIITLTGSIVQCTCTYIFLRIFGEMGINYSLVIGSTIIMIGIWWYSNRVYPMPWFSFSKIFSTKLKK